MIKPHQALLFALATLAWHFPAASWAQSYPAKPVRYVVPFPAGASPDIVARLITEQLSRMWGQQVLVVDVASTSPQEFAQFIRAESARWARVIKDAGIPQQ